jgi:hypothetical protein
MRQIHCADCGQSTPDYDIVEQPITHRSRATAPRAWLVRRPARTFCRRVADDRLDGVALSIRVRRAPRRPRLRTSLRNRAEATGSSRLRAITRHELKRRNTFGDSEGDAPGIAFAVQARRGVPVGSGNIDLNGPRRLGVEVARHFRDVVIAQQAVAVIVPVRRPARKSRNCLLR